MFLRRSSRFAAAVHRARIGPQAWLLGGAFVIAASTVTACSTNNVLNVRPDVDIGTRTSAVGGGGLQELVPDDPYLQQAEARQEALRESQSGYPEQPTYVGQTLAPQDQAYPQAVAGGPPYLEAPEQPAYGERPDAMAGGPPYLQAPAAAPQAPAVAGPTPDGSGLPLVVAEPSGEDGAPIDQPAGQRVAMVAPAGSGLPLIVDEPDGQPEQPTMIEPVEPQPPVFAAVPPMNAPAGPAPMPADEIAIRRELKKLGVVYRELSPIRDSASCQIAHPIKVSVLPGGIQLKPAATLNAEMALTFARWTKDELNPAARSRYWSRVKTIHQMSSYSCRRINGSHSMSEHSKGNALDVGRIELANGKDIDVEKPGLFSFRTKGFLNTVRADGCNYFTTVLGPGYNYDHRNHFHFDIKPRKRTACH